MSKLIIASNNQGKVIEFEQLLQPLGYTVIPQSAFKVESVEETGKTFIENALLKARHAAAICQQPALADDSGLVVPYLKGAPGIYSARYAGKTATAADNNQQLLNALANSQQEARQAFFYCCLVLVQHPEDPTPLIAEGRWHGRIHTTTSGDGGFGYDPLFWLEAHQCTAANLTAGQKNAMSHRGQATKVLMEKLQQA